MITAEELRRVLDYDQDTGIFRWLISAGSRAKIGQIAGCRRSDGYWYIGVQGRFYLAHRLIWLYVRGKWPVDDIDHINMDRGDNRIANLREATRSQNMANSKLRRDSACGLKGVSFHKQHNRWRAQVRKDGRVHHLGYFNTAEEARAAREAAAQKYHGEFAR